MSVCEVNYPARWVRDIEAGPLGSQADAESRCPETARAAVGTWNGNWTTTVPGVMSVCGVSL